MLLANQEELHFARGNSSNINVGGESTSRMLNEESEARGVNTPIQIWQSWAERVRQSYNSAIQEWPRVSNHNADLLVRDREVVDGVKKFYR